METEKQRKFSLLNIEVIQKKGKFAITIYWKHPFSGVSSNFKSSLPSVYKFGMVYTLVWIGQKSMQN